MTYYDVKFEYRGSAKGAYILLLCLMFAVGSVAQDITIEQEPPPLNVIPKEDRDRLSRITNDNARTRLTLDMMRARLSNAETFFDRGDLVSMFRELGIFQGLKDDAMTYLEQRRRSGSRNLEQFKRFEITLRGFVPKLESVRRELPMTHEPYLASLIKSVRETRARATDAMFSDSVVQVPRDNDPD